MNEYTSIINVATLIALYVLPYKVSEINKSLALLWIKHCTAMEIKVQESNAEIVIGPAHMFS